MKTGCPCSPQRAPVGYKKIASQSTLPRTSAAEPTIGVEVSSRRGCKAPATSRSLSQNCAARASASRASTELCGGNRSATSTASHSTYTLIFAAGNSCSTSLSAEAPCTHADQVGERNTTARTELLARSKSDQNRSTSAG